MTPFLISAAFFIFILLGVISSGIWYYSRLEAQAAPDAVNQPIPSDTELAKEFLRETVARVGQAIPQKPKKLSRIEKELEYAGYHNPNSINTFNGIKAASACTFALVSAVAGFLFDFQMVEMLIIGMAGIGYVVPERVLEWRVYKRARSLRSGLPAALDLVILSIEAGQSMDSALMEAGRELQQGFPEIAQEFAWVQMELNASVGRTEAFQNLALRNSEPEIKRLSQVLVDCDRFGTGMAGALRSHVKFLRIRMRQQAREAARKVGVKLVFPVFFLIFPSVLLVTMGPAVLQLTSQLSVLLR